MKCNFYLKALLVLPYSYTSFLAALRLFFAYLMSWYSITSSRLCST